MWTFREKIWIRNKNPNCCINGACQGVISASQDSQGRGFCLQCLSSGHNSLVFLLLSFKILDLSDHLSYSRYIILKRNSIQFMPCSVLSIVSVSRNGNGRMNDKKGIILSYKSLSSLAGLKKLWRSKTKQDFCRETWDDLTFFFLQIFPSHKWIWQ